VESVQSPPAASSTAAAPARPRRPLWLTLLAAYSLLLGLITFIPQLYFVLFAINRQVFPIGPHANPLGQIWYSYVFNGDQSGYTTVDPGTLAGAIEDAFMLGPLYLIVGVGLLRRSRWVVPVGLITGAMIFYANLYFFLSGILAPHISTADGVTTVLSAIPYLIYPLWLVPTLLARRSLFAPIALAGMADAPPAATQP
jgi:hypothetical protein